MTDHPTATDYRNRSERAEQEATEAWACAEKNGARFYDEQNKFC